MNQEEQNFLDILETNYEEMQNSSKAGDAEDLVLEIPSLPGEDSHSSFELPDSFSFTDEKVSPLPLPDFNLSNSSISNHDLQPPANFLAKEPAIKQEIEPPVLIPQDIKPQLKPNTIEESATEEQHIVFVLDKTLFSIPIHNVTEISRPLPVTPLPNVPSWVLGISNFRGDILSVTDLRLFLGKPGVEVNRNCRMLVVRSTQNEMTTALIVDQVRHIRYLAANLITPLTTSVEESVSPYIRGTYKHNGPPLILLDPDSLLLSKEMRQFETAANDN